MDVMFAYYYTTKLGVVCVTLRFLAVIESGIQVTANRFFMEEYKMRFTYQYINRKLFCVEAIRGR